MKIVPHTPWDRFEIGLEWAGEFVNPILVKEARQALKSKQFVITFTLVLLCGWGWSLLGIAWLQEGAYYAPSGPQMLIGYFWVLAFPLVMIVPFTAFRSLASEREDGTYELLSITTLWPRQIIAGKFGSALLQMLVYLSALSPCIAFTYLLRGIDIISILLFVAYVFLASVLLSMGGLLLATVSKARHWQVVLSVAMILLLAGIYLIGASSAQGYLNFGEPMPIDQPHFWIAHLLILSTAASFFVLMFMSASARISFASDNGSTRLRMVMLAQQTLITGWFMFYALVVAEELTNGFFDGVEFLIVWFFNLSAIYWTLTGSIMCGENPQLSQRAKRSLPQSLLARMFFTWFNPGPGTGYMFAVINMLAAVVVGLVCWVALKPTFSWRDEVVWCGLLSFCYVVCYLGVGRIILLLARRLTRVGLFVSFLLQLVLILFGTFLPFVVMMMVYQEYTYSVMLISSPFFTLFEAFDKDILAYKIALVNIPAVPAILFPATGLMLLLNLLFSSSEVVQERIAAPQRVLEDELALHPEQAPRPVRLSPWDDDPASPPASK